MGKKANKAVFFTCYTTDIAGTTLSNEANLSIKGHYQSMGSMNSDLLLLQLGASYVSDLAFEVLSVNAPYYSSIETFVQWEA